MKIDMLGNKVLIAGLGKSGRSAASLALEHGADVWGYDEQLGIRNEKLKIGELKEFKFSQDSRLKTQDLNFDLVVTSPGIPFDHPVLRLAAKNKWPVASEIEFAYNLLKPEFVIAITGTNGKTTVVELLDHIFKLSGEPYTVAGNIGTPLSSLRAVKGPLILELSSFQLHFVEKFRANIAAILNITEDHLDWHCCFGQYLRDKLRIFENQQLSDTALLNIDNLVLRNEKLKIKNEKLQFKNKKLTNGKILSFGLSQQADYSMQDGYLTAYGHKIMAVEELKLKGNHNLSNALAAMACAKEAGLPFEVIKAGLGSFQGLKHRLQYVTEIKGVGFYNDSKSTNPDSTAKAIESFEKPAILIMGGRNKGNDFGSLRKHLSKKVKELILFGEAADEIKEHLKAGNVITTVKDAVKLAYQKAQKGDVIVFSPGCSSFDLYENYAQRGDDFIKHVRELDVQA